MPPTVIFLVLVMFFVVFFFFFDRVTIFFISQNRQLAAKFVDMHFLFLVFSFHLYFICQRNEAGNSPAMEFMGFQRCMDFLLGCGLAITTFISDRHTQIASHMKNVLAHITHYFDLWHLKKSTVHCIYIMHDYIVSFVFLQTIIIVFVGLFEIIIVFHVSLFWTTAYKKKSLWHISHFKVRPWCYMYISVHSKVFYETENFYFVIGKITQ